MVQSFITVIIYLFDIGASFLLNLTGLGIIRHKVKMSKGKQFNQEVEEQLDGSGHRIGNAVRKEVKSEGCPEYLDILGGHHVQRTKEEWLIRLLKQIGVVWDDRYFQDKVIIELIKNTPDFEAFTLKVSMGYFHIPVSVVCVEGKSPVHLFQGIQSTFAQIYKVNDNSVKCFSTKQNFPKIFADAVKEFCLLKISALLQIGPKLTNLFGFDLVIYDQCVQFAMELCGEVSELDLQQIQSLKKKLVTLHQFGIVHCDIKPKNIMLRKSNNESIFIDFGLSECIAESFGFKTETSFVGTLNYCSSEMALAFKKDIKMHIDMYLNDAIGLTKSLKEIHGQYEQTRLLEEESSSHDSSFDLQDQLLVDYHVENEQDFVKANRRFNQLVLKHYLFSDADAVHKQKSPFAVKFDRYTLQLLIRFARKLPSSQKLQEKVRFLSKMFQERGLFQIYGLQYGRKGTQSINQSDFFDSSSQRIFTMFEYSEEQTKFYIYTHHKDRNRWVLSPYLVKTAQTSIYLKSFVSFVNIVTGASNFDEKRNASLIFIQRFKIKSEEKQTDEEIIIVCLRFILAKFGEIKENPFCGEVIPIILKNLIILGADTVEETQRQCLKYYEWSFTSNWLTFKFLFQLLKIIPFHHQKMQNPYEKCDQIASVAVIIQNKMKSEPISSFYCYFERLKEYIESCISQVKQIDYQFCEGIFQNELVEKEDIYDLTVFCCFYEVYLNERPLKYPKIIEYLLQTIQLFQIVSERADLLSYYHLKIPNMLEQYRQTSVFKHIYQRMKKSFQKDELIKSYAIKHFCDFQRLAAQFDNELHHELTLFVQRLQRQFQSVFDAKSNQYILESEEGLFAIYKINVVLYYFLHHSNKVFSKEAYFAIIQQLKLLIPPNLLSLVSLDSQLARCRPKKTLELFAVLIKASIFLYGKNEGYLSYLLDVSLLLHSRFSDVDTDKETKHTLKFLLLKMQLAILQRHDFEEGLKIVLKCAEEYTSFNQRCSSDALVPERVCWVLERCFQYCFIENRISVVLDILDKFYKTIMKRPQDYVPILLGAGLMTKLVSGIFRNLLLNYPKRQFFTFQLHLAAYIGRSPCSWTVNYYIKVLSLCLNESQSHFFNPLFVDRMLKLCLVQNYEKQKYMIILLAVLIGKLGSQQRQFNKILWKISMKVQFVIPMARNITLRYVYYYMMICYRVASRMRCFRFNYQQLMKTGYYGAPYEDYRQVRAKFKGSKLKRSARNRLLDQKLRSYYKCFK